MIKLTLHMHAIGFKKSYYHFSSRIVNVFTVKQPGLEEVARFHNYICESYLSKLQRAEAAMSASVDMRKG